MRAKYQLTGRKISSERWDGLLPPDVAEAQVVWERDCAVMRARAEGLSSADIGDYFHIASPFVSTICNRPLGTSPAVLWMNRVNYRELVEATRRAAGVTVRIPKPDSHISIGRNKRHGMHEVVLRYKSADDVLAALERLEVTNLGVLMNVRGNST